METNTKDALIQYGHRTFGEAQQDLINLIKQYYPEIFADFNDSNIGMLLLDLNAATVNNLSVNNDRSFQETQLEFAQQRYSLINIAKNYGFNIPPKRPSVTLVDFSVVVPALGDKPNPDYLPILSAGAQVIGNGVVFETQDIIDWNSPISNVLGSPNRSIIPNLDSNGIIQSYTVVKREVVTNGTTTVYKRIIMVDDIKPFFFIILPESDVLEIESIILLDGTNYVTVPEDYYFYDDKYRYYEVDYLAQQKIFVDDPNKSYDEKSGLKTGIWKNITKKFIKEYTANGYCKITFGSGDTETDPFRNGMIKNGISNKYFLTMYLQNTALGEMLKPNSTIFIKYKTGGGSSSNIGSNIINDFGNFTLNISGPLQTINQEVKRSLIVTNPIPALGGNDGLSIEQIRNLIKYNFSSQERDITLNDYLVQVYKMPGKYGSPFRTNVHKENNKVVFSILGLDSNGKLVNQSNSIMKENIAEYISGYRMINDYVEIRDGKIFNLSFDIEVYADNVSNSKIANNIITVVKNYLDISKHEMNQDIHLEKLKKEILGVNGVLNILSIKVYNKVGGQYSQNIISQPILNEETGEIYIINNTIYSTQNSMFEIKYPDKDINIFLRKKVTQ